MNKKTLILGASTDPTRYSNIAALRLQAQGYEIVLVGIRQGAVNAVPILQGQPLVEGIDTVTMYLNPSRQEQYYDYILSLQPRRVIFNPGTENPDFSKILTTNHIEAENACTLVLLATDSY